MQKEKVVKQGGVSASKKLSRLLDVLEYIAKQNGRKVGTFEIQGFLASTGIASDIRTIQRDLNLLQDHFCRLQSDKCRPQGWLSAHQCGYLKCTVVCRIK